MPSLHKSSGVCQVPSNLPDIIPFYLPGGGINLLAGAPGVGKTAFLAGLLRDLRDGRAVFGRTPIAVPAIGIINADRGWMKGAGLWFERAGFPDIPYYSLCDDVDLNPKRLRKKFERTDLLASFADKLALPAGSLLCVDPLSLFLGGNLLDYDACVVACHEIRSYLRMRAYTLIGTGHSAKLKADKRERYARMQDQLLGSTALAGFSDAQLYLASPIETGRPYYILVWHTHGAKEQQYYLERDESGLFIPYTGADLESQQRVLQLLPDDGTVIEFGAIVELAEALPLSRRTVKNALDGLIERSLVERVGHGKYRRMTLQ